VQPRHCLQASARVSPLTHSKPRKYAVFKSAGKRECACKKSGQARCACRGLGLKAPRSFLYSFSFDFNLLKRGIL